MNKTINTIHFDITYFCNYHCEYCYQGLEKQQTHISDIVYENFFKFLENVKDKYTVHLIGGEPFLYPRFYEMCERIVKMGHNVSTTTNFSLPKNMLAKFLNIAKGHISFWEISIHLTQIKDMQEFYDKLVWFRNESGLVNDDFQLNCVLTEDNFEQVKILKQEVNKRGFKLNIQRIFNKQDYCVYSDEIENWLKQHKCIDIPLSMVKSDEHCKVCGKACRAGNKFFKILIDGTVTRCFTNQEYGYSLLGDMSTGSKVKILKDYTPCLSLDNKCRCYLGFNKLGQITNKTCKIKYLLSTLHSKIIYKSLFFKYWYYKILKNFTPKALRENLKKKQKYYFDKYQHPNVYGY